MKEYLPKYILKPRQKINRSSSVSFSQLWRNFGKESLGTVQLTTQRVKFSLLRADPQTL
jgi:hypothetical protein